MQKTFERIIERLLVFITATSLMLTAAGIFSTVLNNYEVDKLFINLFTYIVIAVSGIIFSLVLQIFELEKIKAAMHVVFIVFYVIAVLVIAALLGQGYVPYFLIPALFVQYFISAGLNDMFIFHDRFLYECESYEGKELETYLFHNNLSAIDLTDKTKTQEAVLFGLSVAMFIIIVFGKLSDGRFNLLIDLLVILFYLSVMLCYFTIGKFRNDIFYAFLGYKDFTVAKKRHFRSVLLIFLLALGMAALISSDNPLIKINYVQEYKEKAEERRIQNVDSYSYLNPFEEGSFEEDFGKEEKPSWIIELIFEIIKWAAITLLAGAVLYFFLRPFFTKHWRTFWSEGKLITFLKDVWQDIKSFFRFIFSKEDSDKSYSSVQAKSFQETMMDFLKKAKRSKEKNAEIDRLTKYFMRLIDWGESHKIHYRPNLAPAEYTALISQNIQTDDNKDAAKNVGLLFEEALYDKDILSTDEEKLFISAIDTILNLTVKDN